MRKDITQEKRIAYDPRVSTINKSGACAPSCWDARDKGGTVVVIVRVLTAQIKYDPISRCKPRNNGIDFISISPGPRTYIYTDDEGIGERRARRSGANKAGRGSSKERRDASWAAEGPGACARDLGVHIERRMSDVQRARHVVVEVARRGETRERKRNRDVVGGGYLDREK